jgi:3'-5' exoribonuclease
VSAIAELAEERVVEGVYAVARKQRLRTKSGAPYLALELVDPSGRIDARVWHDVELLDARFARATPCACSAASRSSATGCSSTCARSRRPEPIPPTCARHAPRRGRARGFLEFLAGEIAHPGLRARSCASWTTGDRTALRRSRPETHHSYAGGLLEHTVGVATICRETAQLHPRCARDLLLAAALLHDVGRTPSSTAARRSADGGGRLLGHVHLGCARRGRVPRARADVRAELLHAIASTTTRARAHGRGGGAVPREPARRRRRDAPVPTKLASADGRDRPRARREPVVGLRDFFGPLQGRKLGALRTLVYVQLGGLWRSRRSSPSAARPAELVALLAIPAAISGTLGLFAYYRGIAVGAISIVAPIAGVSAVDPVIVGSRAANALALQLGGWRCALVGVFLAAREPGARRRRSRQASGWRCSPRSGSAATSPSCTPPATRTSGGPR